MRPAALSRGKFFRWANHSHPTDRKEFPAHLPHYLGKNWEKSTDSISYIDFNSLKNKKLPLHQESPPTPRITHGTISLFPKGTNFAYLSPALRLSPLGASALAGTQYHYTDMENSPISQQFDIRLARLNQEIHASLAQVRRHLQELEQVEQSAQTGKTRNGQGFAELLKQSMERRDPPASSSH